MEKRNRKAALLLALAVCFAMLFSVSYIAAEADHDCIGENCQICYQISVCENTLKTLSYAVIAIAFAVALTYCFALSMPTPFVGWKTTSLITLKVKLSN